VPTVIAKAARPGPDGEPHPVEVEILLRERLEGVDDSGDQGVAGDGVAEPERRRRHGLGQLEQGRVEVRRLGREDVPDVERGAGAGLDGGPAAAGTGREHQAVGDQDAAPGRHPYQRGVAGERAAVLGGGAGLGQAVQVAAHVVGVGGRLVKFGQGFEGADVVAGGVVPAEARSLCSCGKAGAWTSSGKRAS
jgi:hypothetical protein